MKTTLKSFDIYKYFNENISKCDQDYYYDLCINMLKEYYIKKYHKLLEYDVDIEDVEFEYNYKDAARLYQLFKHEFDTLYDEEDIEQPKNNMPYALLKYTFVLLVVYGFHQYSKLFLCGNLGEQVT